MGFDHKSAILNAAASLVAAASAAPEPAALAEGEHDLNTPAGMLRACADHLERGEIYLPMIHDKAGGEFHFRGQGTNYVGTKDGKSLYLVPVERIMKHTAKWLHDMEVEAANLQAEELRAKRREKYAERH